ncbi:MAG TPA: helix-turn-helix domain-containing protein [Bryobacteraceae bacterium]|nr:helix-turn-helix domain-containing protein [Bryobacteraceae bacterium]
MPGGSDYREIQAVARLAPYVECLWTHGPSDVLARVLPDTCVDLVFSRDTGLLVVGTMTRAISVEPSRGTFVGVRLRAGSARSILGVPINELRDVVIPLRDIWGKRGRDIEGRSYQMASATDGMQILSSAVVPLQPLSRLQTGIAYLAMNGGRVRLGDITRATGLGVRQLRRRCIEETGLSPKHLARVGRFRDVCSRIATDESANWADLACESGYYDQAHLINEFREFSGLTPAAYRHEIHRRPFFPIHEARF